MPAATFEQTLLLLKGHPGTGKSTLANALAQHLGWPLIDKDDIKDALHQLPNGGSISFDILWKIVRHQLDNGLSVIVDSTLSYQKSFENGQALASRAGVRLLVVETRLEDGEWKQRLERRLFETQSHRTSGWQAMQQLLVEYDSSWRYPIPSHQHLVLNTSLATNQLVELICHRLAEPS